ncbi:MAG: DUF3291 domain-containing protein [Armatimonadetes bacterium]|nr:DUF3291 domain-containing protein [Armatimonadota bacterium]
MPKRLAFMTFGHLLAEFGHPKVQEFVDRVPGVYAAADSMEGFVGRSVRSMEDFSHSWGPIVAPKCWGGETTGRTAATLSLWDDIESVAAFAYHGPHGDAMKKRHEWFEHPGLPEHVGWWVEDTAEINWQQAADRMDHLHDHGSTAHAFNLRKPFGPDDQPYQLDTTVIRAKTARLG